MILFGVVYSTLQTMADFALVKRLSTIWIYFYIKVRDDALLGSVKQCRTYKNDCLCSFP